MKKLLTLGIVAFGLSTIGDTITLNGLSFGPTSTDLGHAQDFIEVPKFNQNFLSDHGFDCSGATLNSVKLSLDAQISASGELYGISYAQQDSVVNVTFAGPFSLSGPVDLVASPSLTFTTILNTGQEVEFSGSAHAFETGYAPHIEDFIGSGMVNLPISSAVGTQLSGSGYFELRFEDPEDGVYGAASVDVTYDFICISNVPESSSFGTTIALLLIGFGGCNRIFNDRREWMANDN